MTRQKELYDAANKFSDEFKYNENIDYISIRVAFREGAKWADKHHKSPWIKFTEKFPPHQEPIIIAMKNKNKEGGI